MEDLEQRTGLSRHFLYRCNSKLSELLEPFRTHGDNNQVLYDDNGMIIFDQIKGFKEAGQNLAQIRDTLSEELQNHSQRRNETLQDGLQNDRREARPAQADVALFLEALQESNRQVIEAKEAAARELRQATEQVIDAKDETIRQLKEKVLLITDGRRVEEVRADELQHAREQETALRGLREKQQRRQVLFAELASIEGKWGRGKQRRQLLSEIQGLDEAA